MYRASKGVGYRGAQGGVEIDQCELKGGGGDDTDDGGGATGWGMIASPRNERSAIM
jgi:hypothetical protein